MLVFFFRAVFFCLFCTAPPHASAPCLSCTKHLMDHASVHMLTPASTLHFHIYLPCTFLHTLSFPHQHSWHTQDLFFFCFMSVLSHTCTFSALSSSLLPHLFCSHTLIFTHSGTLFTCLGSCIYLFGTSGYSALTLHALPSFIFCLLHSFCLISHICTCSHMGLFTPVYTIFSCHQFMDVPATAACPLHTTTFLCDFIFCLR